MEDLDIDPEAEEFIRIICGYLADALENALEEVDEAESSFQEVDSLEVAQKHLGKCLSYLELEGWTDV